MRASPQIQAAVGATLRQWADAYSKRDLDRALALIAPDDDVVGIGTGQDEWRVGTEEFKAQIERDFSQAEALSVEYEPLVMSEAGSVAWVAGRASVQAHVDGQDLTLAGRFTAVLEHRNDRWLLMQTHFSVPAADQAEGRSFRAAPRPQAEAVDLHLGAALGPQATWTPWTTTATGEQRNPRSAVLPQVARPVEARLQRRGQGSAVLAP